MITLPLRVELPPRGVLTLRGSDALRFLNGQITQDVRKVAQQAASLPACVTDAKGKLQFWVRIHSPAADTFCVECDAELLEDLFARIDRYLIADDVEITSSLQNVVHVLGTKLDGSLASNRYGVDGCDVWHSPETKVPAELLEIAAIAADELETLMIENGVPAWGAELSPGLLPAEANLEASAVSFHKGCYIGQEVISRIESAGKTPKALHRFKIAADSLAQAGDHLLLAGEDCGWLTRIAPLAKHGKRAALGFIKRGHEAASYDLSSTGQATLRDAER